MRVAMSCLVLAAACTHHRPLRDAHSIDDGDEVVAENHVGQSQPARVAHGAGGELQLHSPIGVLPGHQVARIKETSHARGAGEGLGLGLLLGATIGATVFYASGDDECSSDEFCILQFSAGEKAVIGGIAVGALGAIAGLIVGAATGSTTVYEDGDTRITPIGPQGSAAGMTVTF
jgi:hypothetical protein